MPMLVEVDGVPAVVDNVPLLAGGVVSPQELVTVVFPYRWEREEYWIGKLSIL